MKVKDPVCGMELEAQTAYATCLYKGQTFHFCSANCVSKFNAAPEQQTTNWQSQGVNGNMCKRATLCHARRDSRTCGRYPEADDRLTALLSSIRDSLVDTVLVDALRQALTAHGVQAPIIQVQRVPAIPKTASGKALLLKAYRGNDGP